MSQKLKKIKLGKTENLISAFGGLSIFHNVIKGSYFYDDLKNTFSYMQKRKRGYIPSEKITSHMLLILSGGESLSDIDILNNDEAYKKVTNIDSLPSHSTLDDLYNSINKKDYKNYEKLNLRQAIKYYIRNDIKKITLDVDSSLVFTEKKTAKYTYEKKKGYNPMYVVDEKNKIILSAKFRNGNASPQSDILESLEKVINELEKAIEGIEIMVRSDSAGYQLKIVKYLSKNLYRFAIRGDLNPSKIEEIRAIPNNKWKNLSKKEDICRIKTSINSASIDFIQVDAVIIRKLIHSTDEGYLENEYKYSYVITNIPKYDMAEKQIISFYNQRGNAENIFKELKNDFALNNFPSSGLYANAFYLQVVVSAYNIFQISKKKLFKKNWHKHRLKTIRYYIINAAALIVKSGRRIIMRLYNSYKYFQEFQSALEISYSALL